MRIGNAMLCMGTLSYSAVEFASLKAVQVDALARFGVAPAMTVARLLRRLVTSSSHDATTATFGTLREINLARHQIAVAVLIRVLTFPITACGSLAQWLIDSDEQARIELAYDRLSPGTDVDRLRGLQNLRTGHLADLKRDLVCSEPTDVAALVRTQLASPSGDLETPDERSEAVTQLVLAVTSRWLSRRRADLVVQWGLDEMPWRLVGEPAGT